MMHRKTAAPSATYRLQFSEHFTFADASQLVKYLHNLGISHCYASPIWRSQRNQGYAIVNHSQLSPELGSEEQFALFHQALEENQLGLICDIVPNHMYIVDSGNHYWFDVLENGQASKYAEYFDIDWQPSRHIMENKILLPLLDHPYHESLEQQKMKVVYDQQDFYVELENVARLPTDPKSYLLILKPLVKRVEKKLGNDDPNLIELKNIVTALAHLPPTTTTNKTDMTERLREKERIKTRLQKLLSNQPLISAQFNRYLDLLNGKKGSTKSFNLLEAFLKKQVYRLCFWRMANEEVNYRRFFDFFELAGIKTERNEVFQTTHHLLFELITQGWVCGVRIDHIDGLWDPAKYLQELITHYYQNKKGEHFYAVVEKILIGKERLNKDWPIQGTVGYDFLNQLNGLFVFQSNKEPLEAIYRNFTGISAEINDQVFLCKRLTLETSLLSELCVLSRYLMRLAEQHRNSSDYTQEGLKTALRDVIACFPVYRSYICRDQRKIDDSDRTHILRAIASAKKRNPTFISSLFDFIRNILLREHPPNLTDNQISDRENFVYRFQQLTGPVMAKGIEDTFFYRFYPLPSLNEVGSNPLGFGISLEEFHRNAIERLADWPHTMLASSTHDTKRGEDVRARINVISEISIAWQSALTKWSQLNKAYKVEDDNQIIPDPNEEYLLYATLIGTWPLQPMSEVEHQHYIERIQAYMKKSIKEAKLQTSWINPNTGYENHIDTFIQNILDPKNPFLSDFKAFAKKTASAGALNALSQTLIKLTSPGVPDIYQGNELWDFSLVDPDNRRPVDFLKRIELISTLGGCEAISGLADELMHNYTDGRIKLYCTVRALKARQSSPEIFSEGEYLPLTVNGPREQNVIAFARKNKNRIFVVAAGRFLSEFLTNDTPIIPSQTWKGTALQIPTECKTYTFQDIFTGQKLNPQMDSNAAYLEVDGIFSHLTFALLEGIES